LEQRVTGSGISSQGLDARRRRLLFRAWHRGIREMDLVLGRFADTKLAGLSETELGEFETWLDIPDQQIFAWISGQQEAPVEIDTPLFRALREFRGEGSD
jgi:antitoxin CptB